MSFQIAIDKLYQEIRASAPCRSNQINPAAFGQQVDLEAVRKLEAAVEDGKYGPKWQARWDGKWKELRYESKSDLDFALACFCCREGLNEAEAAEFLLRAWKHWGACDKKRTGNYYQQITVNNAYTAERAKLRRRR